MAALRDSLVACRQVLRAAGLVLLPPRCGACNDAMVQRRRHRLCPPCAATLKAAAPLQVAHCRAAHAALCYQGAVRALVHAAKFRQRDDLAVALGELLAADATARQLVAAIEAPTLVPLPLGRRRYGQRGYNQSATVARVLARRWGVPLRHGLRRCRDTLAQSTLTPAQRRRNVRGAFVARRPELRQVILVDDVITSGATAAEAARISRAAGATDVVVLAVAAAARKL